MTFAVLLHVVLAQLCCLMLTPSHPASFLEYVIAGHSHGESASLQAQEREFGTPNRPLSGSQHLTSTSALLSPRQELRLAAGSAPLTFSPGGSGQWTSRLADTPHEVPRAAPTLAQLADTASTLPLPGSNGLQPALPQISPGMPALTGTLPELPQRTTPRMADTIAIVSTLTPFIL